MNPCPQNKTPDIHSGNVQSLLSFLQKIKFIFDFIEIVSSNEAEDIELSRKKFGWESPLLEVSSVQIKIFNFLALQFISSSLS